jgi:hypothetical protein
MRPTSVQEKVRSTRKRSAWAQQNPTKVPLSVNPDCRQFRALQRLFRGGTQRSAHLSPHKSKRPNQRRVALGTAGDVGELIEREFLFQAPSTSFFSRGLSWPSFLPSFRCLQYLMDQAIDQNLPKTMGPPQQPPVDCESHIDWVTTPSTPRRERHTLL